MNSRSKVVAVSLAAPTASAPASRSPASTREALPPELAHLAEGSFGEALAKAVDLAQYTLAPRTAQAYEGYWSAFQAWCEGHAAPSLPAPPAIVAAYLAERSATLGRSGLRLILAAIAHHHRRAGQPWTSRDPVIGSVMRGILRQQQRPARPAAALTSAEVKRLLDACGGDLAGTRDRALFLLGFAGALRRSELVAVDREHLRFTPEGLVLTIPHSKRDQEGQGASLGIPRGLNPLTCPVRAMEEWLRRSRIPYGAVFRRLSSRGALEGRLTGNGVWRILRRRAEIAGISVEEGERLSPHGLRAGFITEAYLKGALDEQVMHHTRQKSLATTQGYRRRARITRDSPARLLDL
ncbi:site-specific integrase (plasmid) [Roseomonas sp. OT10]|uniref:site-specific integrase n=1 Tax=Roseomonas cutis TaxID=2897332 RepID=UPI001E5E19D1|nr:site-specific integrase [Roseomonas sp. OT10]UFN51613.1 site-specific integrase [Roseomonas sp. OT10]